MPDPMNPLADDASEEERQRAMAAALRGQQTLGVLSQLGDPTLANFGQSLAGAAQHGLQQQEAARQRKLQLGLENKKDAELQQYRKDTLAERGDEAKQRALDRGLQRQFLSEQQALRLEAARGKAEEAKASKDLEVKRKFFTPFTEEFDASKGKNNLNANIRQQMQRGEDLEALLSVQGIKTPQDVEEATAMAAFIANGGHVPSVEQIHGMRPKTFSGDWAEWKQYVTGHPQDAGVQDFLQRLKMQSERINKVGNAQIKRSFLEKVSKHPDVMRLYPEDARRHLQNVGITDDMYDPVTLKATFDPVQNALREVALTPEQAQAIDWARNHKDSPDAAEILKRMGLSR